MTCCPSCGAPLSPSRIIVDLASNTIVGPGGSLRLSRTETELVYALHQHKHGPLEHEAIISALWGRSKPRNPDIAVRKLVHNVHYGRRDRPPLSSIGLDIKNIWGRGYRLVEIETAETTNREISR